MNEIRTNILQIRLTALKTTDDLLNVIVERVNGNHVGSRISKMAILQSVMCRFEGMLDESLVQEIRMENADEFSVLEHLIVKARQNGGLPEELKLIVQRHLKNVEAPKKTIKKSAKPKSDDPLVSAIRPTEEGKA